MMSPLRFVSLEKHWDLSQPGVPIGDMLAIIAEQSGFEPRRGAVAAFVTWGL